MMCPWWFNQHLSIGTKMSTAWDVFLVCDAVAMQSLFLYISNFAYIIWFHVYKEESFQTRRNY
jgi:hypothetical protein